LAASLFVRGDPKERLMAHFTAYFDASGNSDNHPYIVVAGFIANLLQWKQFETQWEQIHEQHNLVRPFHMAEFMAATQNPNYKLQSNARADCMAIAEKPEECRKFFNAICFVELLLMNCGVSCLVPTDVYNEIDSVLKIKEIVPPYALGARMCIERMHQWELQFGIEQPVECICENGDFGQGKFTHLMVDEGMDAPIYRNKKDFAGLQAADHYAWEQFNFLRRYCLGTETEPRNALKLSISGIPKLHTQPTSAMLIKLCAAKGISPRK
jgi:hypothetical protein